jgi:hypothetical protein
MGIADRNFQVRGGVIMSETAAAPEVPARERTNPSWLRGAVAFTIVGYFAIWQGFGLLGYGTDVHPLRVPGVAVSLFVAGLVLMRSQQLWVRVPAVVVGLGLAVSAWWLVPNSLEKGALSLCDAVRARDRHKDLFASTEIEDVKQRAPEDIRLLAEKYPSLAEGMPMAYERWKGELTDQLVIRYNRTPHSEIERAQAVRKDANVLAEKFALNVNRVDEAADRWRERAEKGKAEELEKLPPGDWAAFNRTGAGRRALLAAVPESRAALISAENEWVASSAEVIARTRLTPKPGEPHPPRDRWLVLQKEILALEALDTGAGRFAKARLRLFAAAHASAQAEVAAHLRDGKDELAFGTARAHAVEWDATAALSGGKEQKKLDALREACAVFNKLATKAIKPADPIEPAPPPRAKP